MGELSHFPENLLGPPNSREGNSPLIAEGHISGLIRMRFQHVAMRVHRC